MRSALVAASTMLSAFLAGCEPCSGLLTGCAADPTVAVQGKIVKYPLGTPARDVAISMYLPGSSTPLATAVTNGSGFFEMSAPVAAAGGLDAEFTISPPAGKGYVIQRRVNASTLRGDGNVLELWVARPFFNSLVVATARCNESLRYPLQRVVLRIPPGKTDPVASPGLTGKTDSVGEIVFREPRVVPDTFAPLIGELLLPDLPRRPVGAVRVDQDHVFRAPLALSVVKMAPDSTYVGCTRLRANDEPLVGVAVDFVRTGGANTALSAASTVTDATGAFGLSLGITEPGPVVGDLTIHFPSVVQTRSGVRLGSSLEFPDTLETFGVGPHLPYRGRIRRGTTVVSGATLTIRWTDGVRLDRDSIQVITAADGTFDFKGLRPAQSGQVIVEIVAIAPESVPFAVHDVTLEAVDADVPFQMLDWDLDASASRRTRTGR